MLHVTDSGSPRTLSLFAVPDAVTSCAAAPTSSFTFLSRNVDLNGADLELVTERRVGLVVMGAGGHDVAGTRWLGSTCHEFVRASVPFRSLVGLDSVVAGVGSEGADEQSG